MRGLKMKLSLVIRRGLALLALAAAPFAVCAAGAAKVDFAAGEVRAMSADGKSRPLAKGSEVLSGETVQTGADGRAQLRFTDGAMLSLQPRSEFRLDNYQFSGQADGSERGFFTLLKGGMRTLTGWVGRANRDNYQVKTTVATIGIRGTEYTISYLENEAITVSTGEGRVEVCNRAGCVVLSSGDSAVVRGNSEPPRLTDSRPRLDPPQPVLALATPVYVAGDMPLTVPPQVLPSGSGYSMVYAGHDVAGIAVATSYPVSNVTASFASDGSLQSAVDASLPAMLDAAMQASAGGFSADGVIGWGRWSSAAGVFNGQSADVTDLHYVIGKPASTTDLVALGSASATYHVIGSTRPTDQLGNVGGAPSGTLVATFSAGSADLNLNLSVPINGQTYQASGSGMAYYSPNFNIYGLSGAGVNSGSASGFLAGANASHAGLTYQLETTDNTTVSGAVAFKR